MIILSSLNLGVWKKKQNTLRKETHFDISKNKIPGLYGLAYIKSTLGIQLFIKGIPSCGPSEVIWQNPTTGTP